MIGHVTEAAATEAGPQHIGAVIDRVLANAALALADDPGCRYGLWPAGTDPAERTARLRCLRALVRVYAGPLGERLEHELAASEADPSRLAGALDLLDRLPAVPRRKALASFAALHRPAPAGGRAA